jgi:hypothetical protein
MVQINCSLVFFILTTTIIAPAVALPLPTDDPSGHRDKDKQFYQAVLKLLRTGAPPQAPHAQAPHAQAQVQTVNPAE